LKALKDNALKQVALSPRGKLMVLFMSHRETKIDVLKYIETIVIGHCVDVDREYGDWLLMLGTVWSFAA